MSTKTTLLRRTTAAAICAVAVAATTMLGGAASAAPNKSPSTPIDFPAADGQLMSYVVNAKAQNANKTRDVVKAVKAAGGVAVQEWPEIGVVIAQSRSAGFRENVRKAGNSSVASVGATRTITVAEGTPEGIATPWQAGPQLRMKQGADASVLYGDATFDGVVLDPREGEQWNLPLISADQAHQVTDGSRDVLVGVLDSGIDPNHPT